MIVATSQIKITFYFAFITRSTLASFYKVYRLDFNNNNEYDHCHKPAYDSFAFLVNLALVRF